jgi:hypothetical protein
MSKVIVERVYGYGDDKRVVINESEIETGVFFGASQSYLLDKKIDVEDYREQLEENRGLSITEYLNEKNIGYYALYTETTNCEYNNYCPYKNSDEIKELEKDYPYYLDLDGGIEVYDNKGLLYDFEEVTYFTYYNANNNLETVEIKEEYKKIKLVESCIKKDVYEQFDLYKNKKNEYIVVNSSYYNGRLDTIEEYDISAKELLEKYNYEVE